jgi:hypothetical protein
LVGAGRATRADHSLCTSYIEHRNVGFIDLRINPELTEAFRYIFGVLAAKIKDGYAGFLHSPYASLKGFIYPFVAHRAHATG